MACTGYGNLIDVCDSVKAADGSEWYYVRIAGKYGKPVVAFCGSVADDTCIEGIDRICPVTPKDMPLEEAMRPEIAEANLDAASEILSHGDGVSGSFCLNKMNH